MLENRYIAEEEGKKEGRKEGRKEGKKKKDRIKGKQGRNFHPEPGNGSSLHQKYVIL